MLHTQAACVQGGARNGWGSSSGVSLNIVLWGWLSLATQVSLAELRGGRYEAAGHASASFRNIQAASLPCWGQLEVLTSRLQGRGSKRRGAGPGDPPPLPLRTRNRSITRQLPT